LLSINRPEPSKTFVKKFIGLENKHCFRIYEIEGIKDLSPKKCALFVSDSKSEISEPFDKFDEIKKNFLES
jgi:hypothetical protein